MLRWFIDFMDSVVQWFIGSLIHDSLAHSFPESMIHGFIDSGIDRLIGSLGHLRMGSFMSWKWHLKHQLLTPQLQQLIASAFPKIPIGHLFLPPGAGWAETCNHPARIQRKSVEEPMDPSNSSISPWAMTINDHGTPEAPRFPSSHMASHGMVVPAIEGFPKPPKSRWFGRCADLARRETHPEAAGARTSDEDVNLSWLVVTGTWLVVFHMLGIIIPFDFHIFHWGKGIPPTS